MTQQKRLLQSALCSTIALALILFSAAGDAQKRHVYVRFVYVPGGQDNSLIHQYRVAADGALILRRIVNGS